VTKRVSMQTEQPLLTERFSQALRWASELHARQVRKGTAVPYVAHLLSVSALVLEDGGTEDEAIAALLHDAIEDQGVSADDIRQRFGQAVADIVLACSDTDVMPKPPWRERKERYIEHLKSANAASIRVSLADKLHNARSIILDYQLAGPAVWDRFKASRADSLWYYRAVAEACESRYAGCLLPELRVTVERLAMLP
jgi:(p)ppGpp synthase/HD superfamily hydrolase